MKIHQREPIVWNLILFLALSIIYVYIQQCLFFNHSAYNMARFGLFIIEKNYFLFIFILTFWSIYKILYISKFLLITTMLTMIYETINLLTYDFNKLIFLMGIIHLIFWMSFIIIWFLELKRPIFNPLFGRENLDVIPNFIIKVDLTFLKKPDQNYYGILTNWGKNDCFILMTNRVKLNGRKVRVKIYFKDKIFENIGEIVSSYDYKIGLGVKFKYESKFKNWTHLYNILQDMGLVPEYVS